MHLCIVCLDVHKLYVTSSTVHKLYVGNPTVRYQGCTDGIIRIYSYLNDSKEHLDTCVIRNILKYLE